MAIQTINVGQVPNDGTGDTARASFIKANENFAELGQRISDAQGAAEAAQATADAAVPAAQKGAADGIAPLGSDGKVPAPYLPGFVDDVVEYPTLADFPAEGEQGKMYVALDTNRVYRWSGSTYIQIVASPDSTDEVPEGVTNLYHTAARVEAIVQPIVGPVAQAAQDAQEEAAAALTTSQQNAKPLLYLEFAPSRAMIAAGYGPADGQLLPSATYPDVVPMLLTGNVPVVTEAEWLADPLKRGSWTLGDGDDGSVNFRLPDYNGRSAGSLGALFVRGDGARSAGQAGLIQADALQNITGEFASIRNNRAALGSASGVFFRTGLENLTVPGGTTGSPTLDGIGFDASRVARTADETRSINVTGCWTVKLFGALINPGSADAAQLASDFAALASALQSLTGRVAALESRPRGLFTRGSLGSFSLPGGTYTLVNLAEAAPFNEGIIRVAAGVYAVAEAGMYAFSFCGQVAATTGTTRFLRVDVLDANSAVLKTYSDGFTGYSGTNSLIAVDGLAWLDPSDTIQITAYQGDNSAQSQNGGEHIWHFHLARVA